MERSRRIFLQTLGVGVALVSLPEISSVFNLVSFHTGVDDDLEATLKRLLLGQDGSGAFVAHADTYITQGSPQQLLSAPSALVNMLDQLDIDRRFSDSVNYDDASQCRKNFESKEETWRQHDFDAFTDVKRAPADHDVAMAVGGKIESSHLSHAEGATQYQQYPAITLAENDPGVLVAAKWLLDEHYTPSGKDLAQGLAVIDTKHVDMDDGQTSKRYETPVSSIVHIPRARRNSPLGRRAIGIVAAHNKKDPSNPNNIYYADLYV
jgi:hypothetical protein